jgi:hypothetical protein
MPEDKLKSNDSAASEGRLREAILFPSWIKVGAVAAASALAGGVAAAWYYRKTLNYLRQAEIRQGVPDFGISEEHIDKDT